MLNELKAFFKSFTYAFSGVMHAVRHERNMRFHLCAAVTVLAVSAICGITRAELLAVVICISSVISAELINTAVENAVDAASKNISPESKSGKGLRCGSGADMRIVFGSVRYCDIYKQGKAYRFMGVFRG